MKYVARALVIWFAILAVPLAVAKSIEIKSENFVFVGNMRETDGKALILDLERYRQALLQIFGMKTVPPEIVPVRIYAVRGDKELKLLTGRTDIGGIYSSTVDGPMFILTAKNGFKKGNQARHIALHEYSHHLLSAYTKDYFPLWFNEGMANYYSTFEVNKDGNLVIGRPYNPYGYPLSQKKWMPTKMVVNAISNYPYQSTGRNSRGLTAASYFYAQTWLAVHYIKSHKEELPKMVKYVNLINSGKRAGPAFEQAFERTPEQFHQILKAYYKANKFSTVTVKPVTDVREHYFKVRVLGKGEALFLRAEAMRFFSAENVKTAQVVRQYDNAAKLLGETAEILAARADLASWESDYEKAELYMNQALALSPEDGTILKTAGMILAFKNEVPKDANMDELMQAKEYLIAALKKNPNDPGAKHYLEKVKNILFSIKMQ